MPAPAPARADADAPSGNGGGDRVKASPVAKRMHKRKAQEAIGPPAHVRYALTTMGRELEPAVAELKAWGRRWLDTTDITFRPA